MLINKEILGDVITHEWKVVFADQDFHSYFGNFSI